ncbi:bcl-2-like protein 15 isoform X1 [Ciconia boyciana]|uniref:bcl-2-like protein 15 isoform X1 n=1 Tax=Ciconia boyciana TaxID=52775 RepID=UPI003BA10664
MQAGLCRPIDAAVSSQSEERDEMFSESSDLPCLLLAAWEEGAAGTRSGRERPQGCPWRNGSGDELRLGHEAAEVGGKRPGQTHECVPSAGEPPAGFDPVVVASRLRRMGDQCNVDFERVSSEALAEVLRGKMEKFGAAVESLSRSWINQNPELVYGRVFLSVSVKLLMYLAKKVSDKVNHKQLSEVINGNSQVRSYIEDCGGWGNVDN